MNTLQTTHQFMKSLLNLSAILDKGAQHAESKKIEFTVFLQSRLIADQFDLTRQVQIACDTAKLGMARLSGKEAPNHADTEKTLPELKARIQSTIAYLETFSESDFANLEARHVTTPRWNGEYLTGVEYLNQHVIPNFYFHLATAYSILRANGVDIGKKDFLGKMPFKK